MQRVTLAAVRKMHLELDELEIRAQLEVKARKTRSLGLLRMDLVAECRRRLLYISVAIKQSPKEGLAKMWVPRRSTRCGDS